MRLRDLIDFFSARRDFNLTLYTRQAGLWSMPRLLLDLAPLLSRALQGFALLGLCAVFAGELRRRWTRVRLPEAATRRHLK